MLTRCFQDIYEVVSWVFIFKPVYLSILTIIYILLIGGWLNLEDRLLDSLVVECWLRVWEVPGSIPSQGLRHTTDGTKMVPVVPLFSTQH